MVRDGPASVMLDHRSEVVEPLDDLTGDDVDDWHVHFVADLARLAARSRVVSTAELEQAIVGLGDRQPPPSGTKCSNR